MFLPEYQVVYAALLDGRGGGGGGGGSGQRKLG